MLRSKESLESELRLRTELDRLAEQFSNDEWIQSRRTTNAARMANVQQSLYEVDGDFEWAFDGSGVYGTGMTLRRLAEVSEPLAQTLRWVSHDLSLGDPYPFDLEWGDAVVVGTFRGSFGIRLQRAPVAEQPTLDGRTVFDRAAERIVEVFAASRLNEPASLLESVVGLRGTARSGLTNLSTVLAAQSRPTWIRWRGSTVVTVTADNAAFVADTLTTVSEVEHDETVVGRLHMGSDDNGQFYIASNEGTEAVKHYRGKAADPALLRGVALGSMVRAELHVVEISSPRVERPRPTYTLNAITQVSSEL